MVNEITKSGNLINQRPTDGRSNPLECQDFYHAMTFNEIVETNEEYISHEWSLEGEVPSKLTIDENGVISGRILTFDLQEHCQDKLNPKEPLKADGSNWLNNGRLNAPSYTFNFKVKRTVKYSLVTEATPPVEPTINESTAVVDVNILVLNSHDIDNLMFVRNYLATGKELRIGKKVYTMDTMEDFLKVHPGPFGCTK